MRTADGYAYFGVRATVRAARAALLVLGVLASLLAGAVPRAGAAGGTDVVSVDGRSGGRTFDGVGAVSGGGGNSRLLTDYPEPYRGQILDYLFEPGYGASLQTLKVEIGGDTNSTSGAESSISHAAGDLDCDRGYEWWLMGQAVQRNPHIKLSALAWGAPGYLGTFWSPQTVDYLISWLGCARAHGLTIDSIGGWNEKGYDKAFYEQLHAALRAHGYATKVVAADTDWSVADAMAADPAFAASVDVIGSHYPCGYKTAMATCASGPSAVAGGKPLWGSENGSEDYDAGAPAVARAINRGYIDGEMTSYLNWPLVGATYPGLPFNETALMMADQPWAGSYRTGAQLWAMAHTSQVTEPGWRYVDSATGYFGGDRANGSYVGYRAPDDSAYSVVAETLDATAPRTVTFKAGGGLPAGATVHVWASDFGSTDPADWFVRGRDVRPSGGSFTVTLRPGMVYSFTTTSGQGKGSAAGPARASLPAAYSDDFDHDPLGKEPRYLAEQQGAFETEPCAGGRAGRCVQQQAPIQPINWNNPTTPYALLGDIGWSDYTVSADALFRQPGGVRLLGRVGTQRWFNPDYFDGYYLTLSDTGDWSLTRKTADVSTKVLASGTTTAPGVGGWAKLALTFDGPRITVSVDGRTLAQVTDGTVPAGQVGLGTAGYQVQQFDDLTVTPVGRPTAMNGYQLVNARSGEALAQDATGRGTVQVPAGTGGPAAQWQLTSASAGRTAVADLGSGGLLGTNGRAAPGAPLTVSGPEPGPVSGAVSGAARASGAGPGARWTLRADGQGGYQLVDPGSGLAAQAGPGGEVALARSSGGSAQRWLLRQVPVTDALVTLAPDGTHDLLDVAGKSVEDGGPIVHTPANGGAITQRWRLVADPSGSGAFALLDVNSGKALAAPAANGGQLVQQTPDGSAAQQWRFVPAPGGTYELVDSATGAAAATAPAAVAGDPAPVVAATADARAGERWRLGFVA